MPKFARCSGKASLETRFVFHQQGNANGYGSEAIGKAGLLMDRQSRVMGYARVAEEDLKLMQTTEDALLKEELEWMECFLAGLNAQVSKAKDNPPVEYTIL